MYILCSYGTISAQARTVQFARHVSAAHSSSLCPLSVDNGRMLTILIAKENNNIYHDASHASASIVFRLASLGYSRLVLRRMKTSVLIMGFNN